MPEYLAGPPEATGRDLPNPRDLWLGAQKLAAALTDSRRPEGDPPSWPLSADSSSRFLRLVTLPGPRLAAILSEWWADGVADGMVTVDRRLRLGPPGGDAGHGWIMTGRVRRFTRWHWVPVVVELWPVYDKWTMMTMTPRARVVASQRYFRLGQAVLDRLTAALAGTAASTGR